MVWGVTWVEAFGAIVPLIGFAFLIYQIRQIRVTMLASAHARLEAQYLGVLRIFVDKPHLYPYFYDSAVYDPAGDPTGAIRAEIHIVSESILAMIEHASLQRGSLIDETWETCWVPYARERLRRSSELTTFLHENRSIYTSEMLAFAEAPVGAQTSTGPQSTAAVLVDEHRTGDELALSDVGPNGKKQETLAHSDAPPKQEHRRKEALVSRGPRKARRR